MKPEGALPAPEGRSSWTPLPCRRHQLECLLASTMPQHHCLLFLILKNSSSTHCFCNMVCMFVHHPPRTRHCWRHGRCSSEQCRQRLCLSAHVLAVAAGDRTRTNTQDRAGSQMVTCTCHGETRGWMDGEHQVWERRPGKVTLRRDMGEEGVGRVREGAMLPGGRAFQAEGRPSIRPGNGTVLNCPR